jgi:hypothetical protein
MTLETIGIWCLEFGLFFSGRTVIQNAAQRSEKSLDETNLCFEVFRSVRTFGFFVYPNLKGAEKLMLFSFNEIPPNVGMTFRKLESGACNLNFFSQRALSFRTKHSGVKNLSMKQIRV